MSSEPKGKAVIDDRKVTESTVNSKKINDVVDGEISASRPRVGSKETFIETEIKKKSKQNKSLIDDNNVNVRQGKSETSSKPVVAPTVNQLNISGYVSKDSINRVNKLEVSNDSELNKKSQVNAVIKGSAKSREEILAERESKKKSKQLNKQKKLEKNQEISSEKPLTDASKKSDGGNVQDKLAPIVAKINLDDNYHSKGEFFDSNVKSRGEVLADRELKKKSKQLAKQKKVKSQDTFSEQLTENENKIKTEPTASMGGQLNLNKEIVKTDNTIVKPDVEKSKAELKAERRAKQEAQRAAKEAEKKQKSSADDKENNLKVNKKLIKKELKVSTILSEPKLPTKGKVVSQQRIKLFSHLHLAQKLSQTQLIPNVHPSVVELGIKYSSRIINGSNARCVALLKCLKEVITDYSTPAEKEFSRGLESKLGELTNYLNQCRPFGVSMNNALRHIKSHLTQLPNNVTDAEAKRKLFDVIDTFIREQIDVAGEAICESVKNKITNGDVILIYSCSSLLYRILSESHRSGREFSVIVVDGGPWFEGREMLRRLADAGIKCTYVQISALSFIMRQTTKVLIGAHALLANGCVMSRAGSALVALAAHAYGVPVLVCCETYKFCERVQTDAYVYNELGSPDDLVKEDMRLNNWQSLSFLTPLSIVYDITPPDLVTAVVTDIAILPCTSVPVILRIKPSDLVT